MDLKVTQHGIRNLSDHQLFKRTGDGDKQSRDTVWMVDVSPAAGGPLRRTIARSTLHYYFAHQLQQILDTAGFRVVGQYGDYDQSPYLAEESPRLLLLAAAR